MVLYPSEEWLDEYCRALNESEELRDFGFSEDLLLVITDLKLDEITIGDLNDEALSEVPENVRESLSDVPLADAVTLISDRVRSSLPEGIEHLLDQTERTVIDGNIYIHIKLERGECHGLSIVTNPTKLEVGTIFEAPASTWQAIIAGRPAIAAAMRGDLRVIGNEFLKLKYLAELQLISDIATEGVETEFLFEHDTRNVFEFVFDESLRPPIEMQKWATRECALAFRAFTPF